MDILIRRAGLKPETPAERKACREWIRADDPEAAKLLDEIDEVVPSLPKPRRKATIDDFLTILLRLHGVSDVKELLKR